MASGHAGIFHFFRRTSGFTAGKALIRHFIESILHKLPEKEAFVRHPGKRAAIREEKAEMRRQSLQLRHEVRSELRTHATHEALNHVEKHIPIPPGAIVAGYWPIGRELNVRPLLHHLVHHGHVVVLPFARERGIPLEFREWHERHEMVLDGFQIPAPGPEARVLVPDIMLVPLLSFDRAGHRLGYSAGFYDVTLSHLRAHHKIIAVGVGFASQEVPKVPVDENDQTLDYIVTEHGSVRIAEAS